MDSLKNTMVAIMLLVVTYGVYQVVTTPAPDAQPLTQLETAELNSPVNSAVNSAIDTIPKDVLDNELPTDKLSDSRTGHLQDDLQPDPLPQVKIPPKLLPKKQDAPELPAPTSETPKIDNLAYIKPKPMDSTTPSMDPEIATVAGADAYDPEALTAIWPQVELLVNEGNYRLALRQLSSFYCNAGLMSEVDQQKLYDWLDSLAAKVIYSNEHHLRSLPYIIQPNDSLQSLASRWQIPTDLIYFVNRAKIPDRETLQPGNELKMINGAFDAEIDTTTGTMTLFWKQLYAGRFKVQIDPAAKPSPGEFRVVTKSIEPINYGPYHVGLDNGLGLHAMADGSATSIGLNEQQAQEVFAILSESSIVRILR